LEHQGPVEAASFSLDGRRVVTASADYSARVWDAETGAALTGPLRHGAGVAAVSFSPDGRRVVTGSRQGTARVWDAATGTPVTPLLNHGRGQIRVAFSPDGRRVATGGGTYDARLWDAATGEALGPPLRHRGWVYHLAFSPDGRRLATACRDGAARVWDFPDPDHRSLEDLVLLAQVLSSQRVDATDGLVEVEPATQHRALEELCSRYPADFAGAVAAEPLATAADDDASKKDLRALQGTWKMQSMRVFGNDAPADVVSRFWLVITGTKVVIDSGDRKEDYNCTLDATKKPRAIDLFTPDGKPAFLGIYDLDGDTLKLCAISAKSENRPRDFDSPKDMPVTLRVYNREKK
jgi:uncharacterized protein (TIGR03067 family)